MILSAIRKKCRCLQLRCPGAPSYACWLLLLCLFFSLCVCVCVLMLFVCRVCACCTSHVCTYLHLCVNIQFACAWFLCRQVEGSVCVCICIYICCKLIVIFAEVVCMHRLFGGVLLTCRVCPLASLSCKLARETPKSSFSAISFRCVQLAVILVRNFCVSPG